jgi:predicted Zn finger-like uncharacterized protein
MLTTRCPNCKTTFRITAALLHQARGQVRCGRCHKVFNAFATLTETQAEAPATATEEMAAHERPAEPTAPSSTRSPTPSSAQTPPVDSAPQAAPQQAASPEPATPEPPMAEPAMAEPARPEPAQPLPWHPEESSQPEPRHWWAAAALAGFVLLLQVVHHARGTLAEAPYVGGYLDRVYAAVGMPIPEDTNPANFAIVDWVASARESDTQQLGSLEISAGLRNESDKALSYPLLSLELTDRWEKVIGARVFTADEYLDTRASADAKILPNETVPAQLQLVDPGPDAYGFEVDVCIAIDAQSMRCKSDAVLD